MSDNVTRPPFVGLWSEHRFRVDAIAHEAGVHEDVVFAMLGWHPVKAQDAASVLAELSRRYQRDYSLKTIWVRLREENHATVP